MGFRFSLALLGVIASIFQTTETTVVYKCCLMGQEFTSDMYRCNDRPGINQSAFGIDDELHTPMNASLAYWVPKSLHNETIKVQYGRYIMKWPFEEKTVINADPTAVKKFLQVDNYRKVFELGYFSSEVNPSLVYEQVWCFEATDDPARPIVILMGLKLKLINKCCGKGEILNSRADTCVRKPNYVSENIKNEVLNPLLHPEFTDWFPKKLSRNVLNINYKYMKQGFIWNIIAREDVEVSWKIIDHEFPSEENLFSDKRPPIELMIEVKEKNSSSVAFKSRTQSFCFDAVEKGNLSPRVLMAGIAKARKCCRMGEQLDTSLTRCVQVSGQQVKDDQYGIVDRRKQHSSSQWLPQSPSSSRTPVQYKFAYSFFGLYVNDIFTVDHNSYTIKYPLDGLPYISMNVIYKTGKIIHYNTSNYCCDTISGNPSKSRVLILDKICREHCYVKCCLSDEIISVNGYCKPNNASNWSPSKSSMLTTKYDEDEIIFPYRTLQTICPETKFYVHNDADIDSLSSNKYQQRSPFKTTFFCHDWQQTSGGVREVVASCEMPSNARIYEAVRPLGAVSAALLWAAVAVTVAREETRRSAHGRALACHALCLAVANTLQTAWFFERKSRVGCFKYSLPVYICLLAANFWLTAITFNMAHGFRQPLGAMARGGAGRDGTGGGGGGLVWRRFGLMSAFTLGGTFILTGIVVVMYVFKDLLSPKGIITPSFFETRTCSIEYLTPPHDMPEIFSHAVDLGSLCFYYGPVALLVVVNGVCVVLTIRTVSSLRRDAAVLRRDAPGAGAATGCMPPHFTQLLQGALLYVKLLLTAGILELALEAAAWASTPKYSQEFHMDTSLTARGHAMTFAIAAVFLDLARAAAVLWLCAGRDLCRCGSHLGACGRIARAWVREKTRRARAWLAGKDSAACAEVLYRP